MPGREVWISEGTPGTSSVPVDVVERASPEIATTTTADPGAAGTTLAVTSASKFPSANNYKVRVEDEIMLVTSGAGTTSWTVTRAQDGTTGVAHAIGSSVAQVVGVQRVQPVTASRQVTAQWITGTFRTVGNAASGHNVFSLENQAASKVWLAVRRLSFEMDHTALLAAVALDVSTGRTTALPTGGTTLSKTLLNTSQTSSSSVVARGATASDGGAATAITATLSSRAWHQLSTRMHTAAGFILTEDLSLLPMIVDTDPLVLQPGQGIAVQITGTAASNAATNHYVVKCFCEEFLVA